MFGAPSRDGSALLAQLDDNKNGLRTIARSQGIYGADERLDLSIRTIGKLAEQLGQEPGRKLILWVGPGWPYLSGPNIDLDSKTQTRFFNSIVDFSAVLRHNRITLYSIDPLGTDDGVARPTFYEEFLKGVTAPRQVQIAHLSQQVLAAQSGGLVLHSNNDIAGQIARCIADADTYYILTFDGIPGDAPNEYHPLEVKIDRPGVTARTRTGYYAQPEAAAVPK